MRSLILIACLAFVSISGCSTGPESPDAGGVKEKSGQIETEPAIDPEEINHDFAERLATAPAYTSSIRSRLIRSADEYRQSYRPLIDSYRGLEPDFRCPYPAEAIHRAQSDGWELTRCDIAGAVFLKPVENPRSCEGVPAIPDHYSTLTLRFGIDELRYGTENRKERASFRFLEKMGNTISPMPNAVAQRFSIGPEADDLEYATRDLVGLTAFYFLNRELETLVVLHEPDLPDGCSRNAFGTILGEGVQASIDMPAQDYPQVRQQLNKAIGYFGEIQ